MSNGGMKRGLFGNLSLLALASLHANPLRAEAEKLPPDLVAELDKNGMISHTKNRKQRRAEAAIRRKKR